MGVLPLPGYAKLCRMGGWLSVRHTACYGVFMKEDVIHIRIDPETRAALDQLLAAHKTETLGTVTQSDIVRHAILRLARADLDTQRGPS